MSIKIGSGGSEPKNIYVRINVPDYTVQWKNRDNTVLETDLNVMEGTTPTYNGATPTRSGYDFTGWSPTPAPIYADTDYTAQFTELQYLCFTANTAGSTIKLNKIGSPTSVSLEVSGDQEIREPYTFGNTITLSNVGDKVYWRNTSTTTTGFSTSGSTCYQFAMTGSIAGSGDLNYLLNKNSTTTLSNYCYIYLFQNCTSLTSSPKLTATKFAESCYGYMFSGCTGLTTAPELSATSLSGGNNCYSGMFQGCTGLTIAPKLPATVLSAGCYSTMFYNCSNLTSLPELPATTLTNYCYNSMFGGCTKIKISSSQTGTYQTAYRIPKTGAGTTATYALGDMFANTGGTFTGTPTINTTYYTSNTVV